MHDSRGAELKVGDRVLIEAEVVNLSTGGNENYCCVDVQVVTPEQVGREKVMQPPKFSSMSTKMLTKIGATVVAFLTLAILAAPTPAQSSYGTAPVAAAKPAGCVGSAPVVRAGCAGSRGGCSGVVPMQVVPMHAGGCTGNVAVFVAAPRMGLLARMQERKLARIEARRPVVVVAAAPMAAAMCPAQAPPIAPMTTPKK